MMGKKRSILLCLWCCLIMLLNAPVFAGAQDAYTERCSNYIAKYKALAMLEQVRYGIPAAITLAQGILETDAGTSELMLVANNHFGIKCRKEWTGESIRHTDDAPNECFRKYKCCEDSYKDHSVYLKTSPRYAMLFSLQQTDYAGWAKGLKRCGYATSPTYAQRLTKIIEDFNLQEYTYAAMKNGSEIEKMVHPEVVPNNDALASTGAPIFRKPTIVPVNETTDTFHFSKAAPVSHGDTTVYIISRADVPAHILAKQDSVKRAKENQFAARTENVQKVTVPLHKDTGMFLYNGLKAVHAYKGDMLLPIAVKYNIRYARLLEMNDMADAPLEYDMVVYLEKKNAKGAHNIYNVKNGETWLQIAQAEGIQMKYLKEYNLVNTAGEPAPNAVVHLQDYATSKLKLVQPVKEVVENKQAAMQQNNASGYIAKAKIDEQQTETKTVDKKTGEVVRTTEITIPINAENDPRNKKPKAEKTGATKFDGEPKEEIDVLKSKMDKLVYPEETKAKPSSNKITPKSVAIMPQRVDIPVADVKYYTVKKGETAFGIAKKHNITVQQLLDWNGMSAHELKVGQRLKVTE